MQRHPIAAAPLTATQSLQAVPLSLSHRRGPKPISSTIPGEGEEEDDIHDPRPWETRKHPRTYGSLPHQSHSSISFAADREGGNLPMYHSDENEARRRLAGTVAPQPPAYGEKEGLAGGSEKQGLMEEDVSGKWGKPHGAGPGVGGRRGLPPRQRLSGWVSISMPLYRRADSSSKGYMRSMRNGSGQEFTPSYP